MFYAIFQCFNPYQRLQLKTTFQNVFSWFRFLTKIFVNFFRNRWLFPQTCFINWTISMKVFFILYIIECCSNEIFWRKSQNNHCIFHHIKQCYKLVWQSIKYIRKYRIRFTLTRTTAIFKAKILFQALAKLSKTTEDGEDEWNYWQIYLIIS